MGKGAIENTAGGVGTPEGGGKSHYFHEDGNRARIYSGRPPHWNSHEIKEVILIVHQKTPSTKTSFWVDFFLFVVLSY